MSDPCSELPKMFGLISYKNIGINSSAEDAEELTPIPEVETFSTRSFPHPSDLFQLLTLAMGIYLASRP